MILPKDELEMYLWKHIPISKAMGVTVKEASKLKITLEAPLLNNLNHKKTVFGGSLHAVATLSCWSLLHLNIADIYVQPVQIVIAKSEVNYLLPVSTKFEAECEMPDLTKWERFLKTFQRMGKARLSLSAKIMKGEKTYVDYLGVFVALMDKQ
ncbi:YiiD C-terminal domain-containing protein [Candidatus Protochlamydia amoebophila]|nr:YiiD C-terminal domain-containing protein [Candidatus Protochlamydia amoebophila]